MVLLRNKISCLSMLHSTTNPFFGSACDSGVELDPDCWGAHEKISDADNNKLNAPFTENEVKRAIFDMKKKYSTWPRSYAYRILSALLGDYQGGDHGYVY